MRHLSLFSGIGGFDLAAEWMGWENIAHCEWNPFGQMILKHQWPNSTLHEDITKTDFTIYRGRIDIITGGFPCQPYSIAGKRKGKDDERHLWPEMLRAIREIAPPWVVGENVRGLINWDGGLVFREVQADLEAEGYEILPFLLPAAGVNAPHERYRIWFVAYSHDKRRSSGLREISEEDGKIPKRNKSAEPCNSSCRTNKNTDSSINGKAKACGNSGNHGHSSSASEIYTSPTTNTNGIGWRGEIDRLGESRRLDKDGQADYWRDFPTQSPICNGDDGFPTESLRQRIREDSMGVISEEEIDKILYQAYGKWRNETIKAGGNAIVPQVFFQIAQAIQQYEDEHQN